MNKQRIIERINALRMSCEGSQSIVAYIGTDANNEALDKIIAIIREEDGMEVDIASQEMDILQFLKTNHSEVFDDQLHLDEGTAERAYWHYGRWSALKDIRERKPNT